MAHGPFPPFRSPAWGRGGYSADMRITGGVLRSREVRVPKGERVRPTQDRVREALFSSLAPRLSGARFLDLFAGSGAVGLEAWSRGAGYVCWVEQDPRTHEVLCGNIAGLCGSELGGTEELGWRPVRSDVFRFLRGSPPVPAYDMVFADPPYAKSRDEGWGARLLAALAEPGWLSPGGVFILEQESGELPAVHPWWSNRPPRTYGGSRLTVYERNSDRSG
jgi:16S rRNA (guanine966-N2)-methyltransferase